MRFYRSDAGWQERGKDIRADAVIVSMSPPNYPSVWLHPCRARCCSTWLNHCTSHRDREAIFESLLAAELALSARVPLREANLLVALHTRERDVAFVVGPG